MVVISKICLVIPFSTLLAISPRYLKLGFHNLRNLAPFANQSNLSEVLQNTVLLNLSIHLPSHSMTSFRPFFQFK